MGSRDDDQKTYHPPLLSSLVVRPSHSDSGGGEGVTVGHRDCESDEVRHDPPPSYSRSSRYSDDHGIDVEEELLTVELCLLLNRLDLGRSKQPSIVQEIVVIDNHDLQIANRCKCGYSNSSSNPSYFKAEPKFFPVEPSMEGHYFGTVSVGSYIYLIGGWDHFSIPYYGHWTFNTKNTYCIDANNVVFERTKEQPHLHKLSPLQKNSRTYPSVVTNGKRIYAFGGLEACQHSDDDVEERLAFGEIYDIEKDFWFSFDALPFEDAAQWTTKNCILWDSEEMIVLFFQKNIDEEGEGEGEGENERGWGWGWGWGRGRGRGRGRGSERGSEGGSEGGFVRKTVTMVSYYDLRKESWIDTVSIANNNVNLDKLCFTMAVEGDIVYLVQDSSLHRYDLRLKRITAKIECLEQMKELTGNRVLDIVYLGSSSSCHEGTKYFKFCLFWESSTMEGKFLQFTIIKVGDDGGPKLTVRISSSVGSIPLDRSQKFIKCTHVMKPGPSQMKIHPIIDGRRT